MVGRPRRVQREHGQSLVELAVTFLTLVLLLSAIVDLGRALYSFIAIRDAAQEGALYGSINPPINSGDLQAIIDRVRGSSTAPVNLQDETAVEVCVLVLDGAVVCEENTPNEDACEGNTLRVEVTYHFDFIMPMIGSIIGGEIPITATAVSTILQPVCP